MNRVKVFNEIDAECIDTVGFISDAPEQITDCYRFMFKEVLNDSIVLLVLDASHPLAKVQRKTAREILKKIGLSDDGFKKRVIEVWNKVDEAGDYLFDEEDDAQEASETKENSKKPH